MKMSTIAAAIAGAAAGTSCSLASASSSSMSLTSSASLARNLKNIADTAKRRMFVGSFGNNNVGSKNIKNANVRGYPTLHDRANRRWSGLAFASLPPSHRTSHASSSSSSLIAWPSSSIAQRYFSGGKQNNDDELPWTPIRETHLQMSSNFGTEGFRDAIRYPPQHGGSGQQSFGSQQSFGRPPKKEKEHIVPAQERDVAQSPLEKQRSMGQQSMGQRSMGQKSMGQRSMGQRSMGQRSMGQQSMGQQPPQHPQQQQEQKQQPEQQRPAQQRKNTIPFPKLTPGRKRNYRPPHVVTALRTNAQLHATELTPADEKDYCDALNHEDRDHCIENFRDGRESARYIPVKGGEVDAAAYPAASSAAMDAAPRELSTEEKDYCDALNTEDREHCIENFRDGRGSSLSIPVKGGEAQYTAPHELTTEEKDYCDALDPTDREHCVESFRDGTQSPLSIPVKGGEPQYATIAATAAAAAASRVADQLSKDEPDSKIVNGDVGVSAFEDLELDEDDDTFDIGSISEDFRDGTLSASTRSGSDVSLEDATERLDNLPRMPPPNKLTGKKSFYDNLDNPSSMNFREGKRMSMFKDNAFNVAGSVRPLSKLLDERDQSGEESAYEELLRESLYDSTTEDDDGSDDDEEVLGSDSLLGDATELEEIDTKSIKDETTESTTKTTLLSIDPNSVEIIPLDVGKVADDVEEEFIDDALSSVALGKDAKFSKWEGLANTGSFVKMFRGSASYIANHRGTLAVYHIPGELLAWEGFPGLMDDIALTWLLGMKIVIVAGCRHQIDLRLDDIEDEEYGGEGSNSLGGRVMMSSIRVTDEETLRVVKEEAGFVRFEIERRLAKSLRLHGGLVKGSESLVGNVVSGNFYSAQPFGVVDGIDYCWTGFPRKVEIERIRQVHETNDIVLLTSLGVSPSGEIFNVNSEFLAATVAGSMSASKIIYFNVHGTSFQNKLTEKPVQNLRVSDAKNLLEYYKMRIHPKGFALVDLDGDSPQQNATLRTPGSMETLIKVGYSMVALEKGVKRAHILAPENGALVQELYTRDGCGTLISRDIYEGIRRADVSDVAGISELIEPLVRQGTLVERPKSQLEKEILSYYVYTRDGLILATGQLKRFEGGFAEIGCLVVSKDYRRGGRGDAMLGYLERLSLQCGAKKVFVLSTQTMEWFVERGFREVSVESLPPSRQAVYNKKRKSKIYMKEIDGDRDLDAAELWWSNK